MITMATINDDINTLKSFIEVSGFLDGETITCVEDDDAILYTSGAGITVKSFNIFDENGNMLFRLEQSDNTVYNRFTAYASSELSNVNTAGLARPITEAIACSNGIIIRLMQSSNNQSIVLTRANNGKIAFIYDSSNVSMINNICCIAWGDVAPIRTINLKTHVRPQTLVAPMVTNSSFDELVYTNKGGWMPYNADYTTNIRAILINGRRFITDGTYAIEDE